MWVQSPHASHRLHHRLACVPSRTSCGPHILQVGVPPFLEPPPLAWGARVHGIPAAAVHPAVRLTGGGPGVGTIADELSCPLRRRSA